MAVIDIVKMELPPGVFARKFPGEELSAKTQLIVSESQEAILFKEGNAVGPFGPGRHVLNAHNYPVLTSIVKSMIGRSPFTAEAWFVNKAFNLDVKWGTPSAIQLEDPKYHIMLPVRGFGQYGLAVEDSAKFLLKFIGMVPSFGYKVISDYFRGIVVTRVKDIISKYLVEKQISILQLSAHLKEISASAQEDVAGELSSYGVRVANFSIHSIAADDRDPAVVKLRDALATKAEMDIIGYNYQQKRSFDTLETAAGNSGAGGVMNAGIGLGLGVGIGAPLGGAVGQMAGNIKIGDAHCTQCGQAIPAGARFCPGCGKAVQSGTSCRKCGKALSPGMGFCPDCGTKVE